jgi:hypothetical protein
MLTMWMRGDADYVAQKEISNYINVGRNEQTRFAIRASKHLSDEMTYLLSWRISYVTEYAITEAVASTVYRTPARTDIDPNINHAEP